MGLGLDLINIVDLLTMTGMDIVHFYLMMKSMIGCITGTMKVTGLSPLY